MGLTRFHRLYLGFTRFYRVDNVFYWVLLGFRLTADVCHGIFEGVRNKNETRIRKIREANKRAKHQRKSR